MRVVDDVMARMVFHVDDIMIAAKVVFGALNQRFPKVTSGR